VRWQVRMPSMRRVVAVALLATFCRPALKVLLFSSAVETLDFDKVQEWGLKGPFIEGNPVLGVWLFVGLLPNVAIDTSYCRAWDPQKRTLICDMGEGSPSALIFSTGVTNDVETSPGPPPWVPSSVAMKLFGLLRYRVFFRFNEDLTKAHIQPGILGVWIPTWVQDAAVVEMMEKGSVASKGLWKIPSGVSLSGAWVRNNYAHGMDKPPGTGYLFLPVLKPSGHVDRSNLARAKAKIGPGNQAIRWAKSYTS